MFVTCIHIPSFCVRTVCPEVCLDLFAFFLIFPACLTHRRRNNSACFLNVQVEAGGVELFRPAGDYRRLDA